jgi:hypothetical protein
MAQTGPSIIILLIIILPLIPTIAFWLGMFREMMNNDNLPPGSKEIWMWLFLFFNVFAAMFYYVNVYKER